MRKIREVLRLRWTSGLSLEKIAGSCAIGETTVRSYLTRAEAVALTIDAVMAMDDGALNALLFPPAAPTHIFPVPEWHEVFVELKRKGVTKRLLWEEYRDTSSKGYGYSQYCELYREWLKKQRLSMHQEHKAGEKTFVDWAGQTIPIYDPKTGSAQPAYLFVAALGASQYTYAEAFLHMDLTSWISAHNHAVVFFAGVTAVFVPDNLKTGVNKACRYEPDLNPTYHEWAVHHDTVVIPARAQRPKDKAIAEGAVGLSTRWIIAVLRHRRFFSVDELNTAIRELLVRLNIRPFQKKSEFSRRSLYETIDRPALKPLPSVPYEFAETTRARVNIDYHIAVDDHFYSTPYQLQGEVVFARMTATTVEVLHKNRRIFTHRRSFTKYGYTTIPEHMPEAHRRHLEWTPSRIIDWAKGIGPNTQALVETIMSGRPHPELGYRACLGIFRMAKGVGGERMEAACRRAIAFNLCSYKHVKMILDRGLDRVPVEPTPAEPTDPIRHSNIRGGEYYRQPQGETDHDQRDDGEASNAETERNGTSAGGTAADARDDDDGLRATPGDAGGQGGNRTDESPVGESSASGETEVAAGVPGRRELEK